VRASAESTRKLAHNLLKRCLFMAYIPGTNVYLRLGATQGSTEKGKSILSERLLEAASVMVNVDCIPNSTVPGVFKAYDVAYNCSTNSSDCSLLCTNERGKKVVRDNLRANIAQNHVIPKLAECFPLTSLLSQVDPSEAALAKSKLIGAVVFLTEHGSVRGTIKNWQPNGDADVEVVKTIEGNPGELGGYPPNQLIMEKPCLAGEKVLVLLGERPSRAPPGEASSNTLDDLGKGIVHGLLVSRAAAVDDEPEQYLVQVLGETREGRTVTVGAQNICRWKGELPADLEAFAQNETNFLLQQVPCYSRTAAAQTDEDSSSDSLMDTNEGDPAAEHANQGQHCPLKVHSPGERTRKPSIEETISNPVQLESVTEAPDAGPQEHVIPKGIKNDNRKCYRNAALQLLLSMPAFTETYLEWLDKGDKKKKEAEQRRLLRIFSDMIDHRKQSDAKKIVEAARAVAAPVLNKMLEADPKMGDADLNEFFADLLFQLGLVIGHPQAPVGHSLGEKVCCANCKR
jgi:hypothetical protein